MILYSSKGITEYFREDSILESKDCTDGCYETDRNYLGCGKGCYNSSSQLDTKTVDQCYSNCEIRYVWGVNVG